jgi:arabinogalactan endo-1,4-beta-galactosidase
MTVLLDLHYSDTWADPGKQYKPGAWDGLPFAELGDSVYAYTRDVLATFRRDSALPDVVQIGNEITPGFLWDDGRVGGQFDTPEQWRQFGELLKSATSGVRDALTPGDHVEIMIHIDRGGDAQGAQWFFDRLASEEVSFDVVGLSYYPWWHGSLDDLRATMGLLAEKQGKPIMVVETAYPWTLSWFDDAHNLVGLESQLHPGFPATVEGQRAFLAQVIAIVGDTPGGLGRGVFYWAPEWIAVEGVDSAWENMTLFDEHGEMHIGDEVR